LTISCHEQHQSSNDISFGGHLDTSAVGKQGTGIPARAYRSVLHLHWSRLGDESAPAWSCRQNHPKNQTDELKWRAQYGGHREEMKKFGWGILFVFMVLLIWNTRVTVPDNAEAIGFDLWALFLIFLTFLVGRKLRFTLFPKTPGVTITANIGETEKVGEPDVEEVDEPCVTFDLADERMNKNSGWDRVHVYANRYERSSCEGGPPSYDDVFEYAVQEKKVYQRVVEKKTNKFFKTTDKHKLFEVKDGVIVEDSMKILDAEDDILYAPDKQGLFNLERPDRRGSLKLEISWHEVHDTVIRYALWATKNTRDILIAESARLNATFFAVDGAAKKLGGTRDEYGSYRNADGKVDDALKALQSDEGLTYYGISLSDMFDQEKILKVLTQAIDQKK
jgi:hypothetical protein